MTLICTFCKNKLTERIFDDISFPPLECSECLKKMYIQLIQDDFTYQPPHPAPRDDIRVPRYDMTNDRNNHKTNNKLPNYKKSTDKSKRRSDLLLKKYHQRNKKQDSGIKNIPFGS